MNLNLEKIFYLVSILIFFIRVYYLESKIESLTKRNYELLMRLWKKDISEKKENKNGD